MCENFVYLALDVFAVASLFIMESTIRQTSCLEIALETQTDRQTEGRYADSAPAQKAANGASRRKERCHRLTQLVV